MKSSGPWVNKPINENLSIVNKIISNQNRFNDCIQYHLKWMANDEIKFSKSFNWKHETPWIKNSKQNEFNILENLI